MTSRTLAARYARALLDVAGREADLEKVATDLHEFLDLFNREPALQRVLLNPAVPVGRKAAAVTAITKLTAQPPVVSKLLILLAERDRLSVLPDLVRAYDDLLMTRQGVVRAEVVSAEPVPQPSLEAIEQRLAAVTGKRVAMTARVDGGILGGLVARVGSTVYDASLATQLRKIRERLTA
jgi:F-type H+-transporting ATPase subunit delta